MLCWVCSVACLFESLVAPRAFVCACVCVCMIACVSVCGCVRVAVCVVVCIAMCDVACVAVCVGCSCAMVLRLRVCQPVCVGGLPVRVRVWL